MNWALIYMTCFRLCTPQYVELYATRAECMAQIPAEKPGMLSVDSRPVCVAAVPGVAKK